MTAKGAFYIVIRAREDATLHIWIDPGDTVSAVVSIEGTIKSGAQPLYTTRDVEVFTTPAFDVAWQDVFTPDEPLEEPEQPEEPETPEEWGE